MKTIFFGATHQVQNEKAIQKNVLPAMIFNFILTGLTEVDDVSRGEKKKGGIFLGNDLYPQKIVTLIEIA